MTARDMPQDGWLIHKAGRGWYRPKAQGYTAYPSEAGRYSHADALSYSHPNGWSGPRDGITIKHESELEQRHTPATPLAAALAVPEVRATTCALAGSTKKKGAVMADLRKLIEAVEAGTATGGDGAMVVPRDMSDLIVSITGDDDELWSAFVGAHDGSLDDAKALHDALLPGWSVMEIDQDRAKRGRAEWMVCIRDDIERIDPGHCVTTMNDMLSRAWLLSILRAMEAEKTE